VLGFFNITGFYNDFRDQQILVNLSPKPGAPGGGAHGSSTSITPDPGYGGKS
jgi:hypothetical protein